VSDRTLAIGPEPLDVAELVRLVCEGDPGGPAAGHGAVVTFVGTVRGENQGRKVVRLEYEAYTPLALRAFRLIADEAAARWPSARVAFHHRVGPLALGEASVAIAAASPHRSDAFAACRYVIERLKQIAPVWKREFFEGGDVWIEGATADPSDEAAREEAYRRSCG
jgi:molybdopterin synthase catalytic subunit